MLLFARANITYVMSIDCIPIQLVFYEIGIEMGIQKE